jgi:hypothetical protein
MSRSWIGKCGRQNLQTARDEIKSKLEETTYFKATVIGWNRVAEQDDERPKGVCGGTGSDRPAGDSAGETWTVSRAIMKAGGFTNFADKKRCA